MFDVSSTQSVGRHGIRAGKGSVRTFSRGGVCKDGVLEKYVNVKIQALNVLRYLHKSSIIHPHVKAGKSH